MIIPPDGYLAGARDLCERANVLLIADEIQSGLGRTGTTFACEREGVTPDLMLLGKALGGGIVPISAVVGSDEVLGLFRPGEHGSTFGGNPLACAIALAVLELLADGSLPRRAAELGSSFGASLAAANHPAVTEIRQRGLWIGVDLDDGGGDRPRRVRAADGRRGAGEGDSGADDPLRAAADNHRRRARVAARARQRSARGGLTAHTAPPRPV